MEQEYIILNLDKNEYLLDHADFTLYDQIVLDLIWLIVNDWKKNRLIMITDSSLFDDHWSLGSLIGHGRTPYKAVENTCNRVFMHNIRQNYNIFAQNIRKNQPSDINQIALAIGGRYVYNLNQKVYFDTFDPITSQHNSKDIPFYYIFPLPQLIRGQWASDRIFATNEVLPDYTRTTSFAQKSEEFRSPSIEELKKRFPTIMKGGF